MSALRLICRAMRVSAKGRRAAASDERMVLYLEPLIARVAARFETPPGTGRVLRSPGQAAFATATPPSAVEFGERIDRGTSERVLALHDRLARRGAPRRRRAAADVPLADGALRPPRTSRAELAAPARAAARRARGAREPRPAAGRFPVCYDAGLRARPRRGGGTHRPHARARWSSATAPPPITST